MIEAMGEYSRRESIQGSWLIELCSGWEQKGTWTELSYIDPMKDDSSVHVQYYHLKQMLLWVSI